MSFRRFLYLAADDCAERTHSLRRIDMSRLFFRPSTSSETEQAQPTPLDASGGAGADLPAIKDGGLLPAPAIHVRHPLVKQMRHSIDFVLFEDKVNWRENKVVAMDNLGRALMCYPEAEHPAAVVGALPSMASSKFAPFAVTVGGSLYVMSEYPERPNASGKCRSFEVLAGDDDHRLFKNCEEWRWHPLAPPPSVYGPRGDDASSSVESHAVVAGAHIVVSNRAAAPRAYSFDTVARKWSTAGHWALPFTGAAAYVPEHKLWFGISSLDDGDRFCAADLVASPGSDKMRPPELHGFWKEYVEPPPEWSLERSYAVHLGSCRFCVVRFFEVASAIHVCPVTNEYHRLCPGLQAVFTGVEVDNPCGDQLRVLRHKSERYKLDAPVDYRIV
ncbi:hypothetical protein EJB05_10014, partial [Eragrostis curvula]